MGAFFSLLLRWFLGAFARLFTVLLNNALAMKIVLTALFVIILPIVLNNVLYDLMSLVFDSVNSYVAGKTFELENASFSGMLGYFMVQLGIPDCLSVVLSAMALRFSLAWIPFVGPK
jgi:hypothetical protein